VQEKRPLKSLFFPLVPDKKKVYRKILNTRKKRAGQKASFFCPSTAPSLRKPPPKIISLKVQLLKGHNLLLLENYR
jgi:hypothetical protein